MTRPGLAGLVGVWVACPLVAGEGRDFREAQQVGRHGPTIKRVSHPAIVLLNSAAQGGRAAALRRPMEQWLAHHAPSVPLLAPGSADAALATLMVVAPLTRVVVVGGDGTVNQLLPAFLRCGHRLGLVAAGRNNQLAEALGVAGLDWRRALAYALKAPTAPIDVGELHAEQSTHYFVADLAMGYGAELSEQMQQAPAFLRGRARQLWARLAAWGHVQSVDTQVWVNGQLEHDGPLLLGSVLNADSVSGELNNGRLDAVLLSGPKRRGWAQLLPQLIQPKPGESGLTRPSSAQWRSGNKWLIDARSPLRLAVDGERLASLSRFSVQVLPRAVHAAGRHAAHP